MKIKKESSFIEFSGIEKFKINIHLKNINKFKKRLLERKDTPLKGLLAFKNNLETKKINEELAKELLKKLNTLNKIY